MADIYKVIKRHKGLEYVLVQNRRNSANCFVEAFDRKTGEHIKTVAKCNNKTQLIIYYDEAQNLSDAVREVIEYTLNPKEDA